MTDPAASRPAPTDGREALLAATVKVVARRGLRGASYRVIADEAGVNNTLISHHFGSRQALLVEAMDWAVRKTSSEMDPAGLLADPDGFAQRIVSIVDGDPDLQVFQFEILLESRRTPSLAAPITALYERYIASVANALAARGCVDADIRARAIFAACDGLVLQRLTIAGASEILNGLALVGHVVNSDIATLSRPNA